ncbi:glycosyltransferase family 2 protein [Actinocorallia longicatena]|uniref:Glycosyltransferase family 2 protein n=1 Tax=Actinocorallia longicatena TaxID=111803 RepID=A0ABP6QSG9_9ACTN
MTALSVIVPMRDVERHVGDMLLSLTRNIAEDIEFILVDDGSTDGTPRIIDDHRARIPRLSVVRHEKAVGLSAARNAGMRVAEGRHFTFLDGDDYVLPGYFPKLAASMDALGVDYVKADHIKVYGRRRVPERAPMGLRNVVLDPREGILPSHGKAMVDYPNAWSGAYRRELYESGVLLFDERLLTCEDRPWTWRLHLKAASYAVVPFPGVFYRREVAGSLTQIGDERQLHFFDAFDLVLAELERDHEGARFLSKAVRNYLAMMAFHLTERERLLPPLRRRLVERARTTFEAFPESNLQEVMPGIGPERRQLFAELLGISA